MEGVISNRNAGRRGALKNLDRRSERFIASGYYKAGYEFLEIAAARSATSRDRNGV